MNDDPNGVYEIVLAEDDYYRKMVDKLQIALNKLVVAIYFVNSKGRITQRTRQFQEENFNAV